MAMYLNTWPCVERMAMPGRHGHVLNTWPCLEHMAMSYVFNTWSSLQRMDLRCDGLLPPFSMESAIAGIVSSITICRIGN